MPTLANFDGRSLVADLTAALGNVKDIGQRSREETAAQEAENLAITAAGGTPQPQAKGPLNFLSKIAPELFATVQQLTTGRADPTPDTVRAVEDTRARAKSNIAVANRILREPDPVKKQRIVREDAERIRAAGGDVTGHVKMSNLSPDELDLQAEKIKLTAEATNRALPGPTEAEREIARIKLAVRSPQAAEALRRQEVQNFQIAQAERERQAAAAAPQTELGQQLAAIERDLRNGAIDPQTASAMAQRARTAATVAGGPAFTPVLNDAGQIIAQRNNETGELKSAPEAIVELSKPTNQTKALGLTPTQTGVYNAAIQGGATPDEAQRYATAPAPTRAKFDQFTVARKAIEPLLDDWIKFIDENGGQIFPGTTESQEAQTKRRAIQLQLKEILNLGVLNGPDLKLIDEMLAPTQLGFGNLTALKPGLTAERTRASVRGLRDMLNASSDAQREVLFGPTTPPSDDIEVTQRADRLDTGGANIAAAPVTLPEITNKAEFDALPSGTEFTSGGRRFRKP